VPLVEYMIGRALVGRDLATHEAKARAVRDLVESILGRLQDPVIRERYAAVVAAKTGTTENAVLLELQRTGFQDGGGRAPEPPRVGQRMGPGQKVEREALKLLVQAPELCSEWLPGLSPDAFSTPTHQRVFELLRDSAGTSPADLMDRATDRGEHVHKLMAALAVEPVESGGGTPTVDYAQQVFIRLEEFALSRRIDGIRKQLERLNPMTAQADYDGCSNSSWPSRGRDAGSGCRRKRSSAGPWRRRNRRCQARRRVLRCRSPRRTRKSVHRAGNRRIIWDTEGHA
jgi:DNA primase